MIQALYVSPKKEAWEAYVAKTDLPAGSVKWCSQPSDLYGWSKVKVVMGDDHWLLPVPVIEQAKIIGILGGLEYEVAITEFGA